MKPSFFLLCAAAVAHRLSIHHATIEDKHTYGLRLAAASAVDPAVVQFALTDVHRCGHDTGGNRNALLRASVFSHHLMLRYAALSLIPRACPI